MAAAMNAARLARKPIGLMLGAGAGLLAGLAFERAWRMLSGSEEVPSPIDEDRGWGEILTAAALQGAVFAVVKAAVDRASAQSVRRFTGRWPA